MLSDRKQVSSVKQRGTLLALLDLCHQAFLLSFGMDTDLNRLFDNILIVAKSLLLDGLKSLLSPVDRCKQTLI